MSRGTGSGSGLRGLPLDRVRADFDRIAQVSEEGWNHSAHYYPELLRLLPARIERALEVGCGIGDFTRRLAPRVGELVAIDLSPEMIRIARQRSANLAQVRYEVADVMTWSAPADGFDAAVAIATLHHLPYQAALARLASRVLPEARTRRHGLWRFSIVWRRPA